MALREINLLPPDTVARRLSFRHLLLWLSCLFLSLAVVSGAYVAQSFHIKRQEDTLLQMKAAEARLSTRIDELKSLQGALAVQSRQRAGLNALRAKTQSASRIVAKLSEIMNGGTWLSQLSLETMEKEKGETIVTLGGYALSNDHLGDFLTRLSVEPMFRAVTLQSSLGSETDQQGQKGGPGRIRFQIGCRVNRG